MSELIRVGASDAEPIRLGDESSTKEISFQLAQDFYNEITGKSERLSEKLQIAFILTLQDIENLNHRLVQSTEQYNIVSQSATFSVKYVGDSSERYSSIERLSLHATNKGLAIEELDITYKMLIVLPKTQRPQEYKISINLISRVAKTEEMRKDMEDMPFSIPFYRLESMKTCEIYVDFVDISVANAIMSTIKKWAECVKTTQPNQFLRLIRRKSHIFPSIVKYAFLAVTSLYIYQYSLALLTSAATLKNAVNFALMSILVAFIAMRLGRYIGIKAERNLDEIYEISYIHFSSADERFVQQSKSKIAQSAMHVGYSIASAFVIGIASSIIATLMLASNSSP